MLSRSVIVSRLSNMSAMQSDGCVYFALSKEAISWLRHIFTLGVDATKRCHANSVVFNVDASGLCFFKEAPPEAEEVFWEWPVWDDDSWNIVPDRKYLPKEWGRGLENFEVRVWSSEVANFVALDIDSNMMYESTAFDLSSIDRWELYLDLMGSEPKLQEQEKKNDLN